MSVLSELFAQELKLGEFKPVAYHIPHLDLLVVVEKDCSVSAKRMPGSNIELLYDSHKPETLVGVHVWGFSQLADFTFAGNPTPKTSTT